jgi:prepilin-type processing-associated H-X9-DG protein/prepilin-type N-terminal cleavage/methylation domain-containing protein
MFDRKTRTYQFHSRAFTIVELLTVLAVIAVLSGMLFAGLRSAKGAAKGTSCASNLSQLHKSVSLYLADNDERYPYLFTHGETFYKTLTPSVIDYKPFWHSLILPYAKNVLFCPEAYIPSEFPPLCVTGYAMNSELMSRQGALRLYKPRLVAEVESPSSTVETVDYYRGSVTTEDINQYTSAPFVDFVEVGQQTPPDFRALENRHNGKMNVAFVDGHVKSQTKYDFRWENDGTHPSFATNTPRKGINSIQ